MPEAWFAREIAPFFSLLSLTAVIASLDVFVQRGEHRGLVRACYAVSAFAGLALLAAGAFALATGQPWYVEFALGFPGAVMLAAFGWSALRLDTAYSAAEHRRTMAKDI